MSDTKENLYYTKTYICHSDVVLRNINGVYLLIPCKAISTLRPDQFVMTNHIGAIIWDSCKNGAKIDNIAISIANQFAVEKTEVQKDIYNVIKIFDDLGILLEVL